MSLSKIDAEALRNMCALKKIITEKYLGKHEV